MAAKANGRHEAPIEAPDEAKTVRLGEDGNAVGIMPATGESPLVADLTKRALAIVATMVVATLAVARAATAADIDARALAASCRSCHQPGDSVIPSLDGQSSANLVAKLRGYRDGSRAGTVMPELAKGYTDAELEAIARHLASERR